MFGRREAPETDQIPNWRSEVTNSQHRPFFEVLDSASHPLVRENHIIRRTGLNIDDIEKIAEEYPNLVRSPRVLTTDYQRTYMLASRPLTFMDRIRLSLVVV